MICEVVAIAKMELEPNGESSKLKATSIGLELSPNMNRSAYFDNGQPNINGGLAMTQAFIQGLVGNIHSMHQKGHRDSAEHLRYIIAQLERGFVQNVEVT